MKLKLIDRYILSKFMKTFFFVLMILLLVVCVIDYSEKSDDFLEAKLSLWQVLNEYYLNFMLYIALLVAPLIIFIAAVFVTAQMASRTELIAMLGGGMSLLRILRPYFAGAFVVAAATFYLSGWVLPKSNKERINFEIAYIKSPYFFDERNVHFKVKEGVFAYFQSYNNNINTGYRFTLERIENLQMLEKLSADVIRWDTAKKVWHMDRYRIQHFNGEREYIKEGTNLDTTINVLPDDFESKHMHQETLSLPEIDAYISDQLKRGNSNTGIYMVEKYQRYASPFAIIILTLMAVIISSRKSRQGTSFQIAMGFVLAFIFLIMIILGRSLGQAGSIDPAISVTGPPILFGIIAIVLYRFVPK